MAHPNQKAIRREATMAKKGTGKFAKSPAQLTARRKASHAMTRRIKIYRP